MTLKRVLWLFLVASALFIVDFFSKSFVSQNIPLMSRSSFHYPYGGITVFHDFLGINFSINHVINRGAAWGSFASFQQVLLYLRILIISGLLVHFLFFNKDRLRDIPFMLIITGAISNVVDFFIYGHVVDMFNFTFGSYAYPLFNIADSSIFCGVALLILLPYIRRQKKYGSGSA